jgi:hypothetical protein
VWGFGKGGAAYGEGGGDFWGEGKVFESDGLGF